MDKYSFLNAAHTVYFSELYEQYQKDPDSMEPSWRAFFQGYDFGSETYGLNGEIVEGVSTQVPEHVQKEFQVVKLIDGYRTRGHLFTKTNPVRERRKYAPTLEIENFGLQSSDLDIVFNAGEILGIGPKTLREIRQHLEAIYCDSIGIEYMYIRQPDEIQWIQNRLNQNDNHGNFSVEEKKLILDDYGIKESGLDLLIREAYDTLGLNTFFTCGEKEVRAWTMKKGAQAVEAAGEIHSDFATKFIKAEIYTYQDAINNREKINELKTMGLVKMVGRDYIMQEGDIAYFIKGQ